MSTRKTELPNARVQPRFGGIATFGRYPRLEDVKAEGKDVDWAIVGAPFDGGVTFRPGARFGPRAIREQSQYLKHYSLEHEVDVPGVLSLADAGERRAIVGDGQEGAAGRRRAGAAPDRKAE